MDIYSEIMQFYQQTKTEKRIIGRSLFGRNLYAVKLGAGRPIGIVQYGIHAREWITAKLALVHYVVGLQKGSCWLLPLTNPDGALLSQTGLSSVPDDQARKHLLALNNNKKDFSLWKANGRGVDLNVNFDAQWGKGRKNTRRAGGENYIGEKPFSEVESYALKCFTEEILPNYTISYHTKGEEIYPSFFNSTHTCPLHFMLANSFSRSTGYSICEAKGSVGGFKDWCEEKWNIPSLTVEVGRDCLSHPIGEDALQEIIEKNAMALYELSAVL